MREVNLAARGVLHGLLELSDDGASVSFSVAQIAHHLGSDPRTVERNLMVLEGAGAIAIDEAGTIHIRANQRESSGKNTSANRPKSEPYGDQEVRKKEIYTNTPHPSPEPARARSNPRANLRPEPAAAGTATKTGRVRQRMFPGRPEPVPETVAEITIPVALRELGGMLGVDDVEARWPGFSRMLVGLLETREAAYYERVVKHAVKGLAWRAQNIEGARYFAAVITRLGERIGYDALSPEEKLRLYWHDETWLNLLRSNPERKSA